MCGLFGWFSTGTRSARDRHAYGILGAVLAVGNETRGDHSWGIWDRQQIRKGLGGICQSGHIAGLASRSLVLAHTRFATTGARTADNAHPFRFGKIVGAHNGMLDNHFELNLTHGRTLPVDSMHIFVHLANGLPLADVRGYGAITYDTDGEGVRLGRWNGGVLTLARLASGWVWSSERAHLENACALAGLAIRHLHTLKEGTRYHLTPRGDLVRDGALGFARARGSWTGAAGVTGASGARYIEWDDLCGDWNDTRRDMPTPTPAAPAAPATVNRIGFPQTTDTRPTLREITRDTAQRRQRAQWERLADEDADDLRTIRDTDRRETTAHLRRLLARGEGL